MPEIQVDDLMGISSLFTVNPLVIHDRFRIEENPEARVQHPQRQVIFLTLSEIVREVSNTIQNISSNTETRSQENWNILTLSGFEVHAFPLVYKDVAGDDCHILVLTKILDYSFYAIFVYETIVIKAKNDFSRAVCHSYVSAGAASKISVDSDHFDVRVVRNQELISTV